MSEQTSGDLSANTPLGRALAERYMVIRSDRFLKEIELTAKLKATSSPGSR